MKKALIAALAALGVSAWTAPAAFAQNHDGRGRHERNDRDNGDRGEHRRDGDSRRDESNNNRRAPPQRVAPTPAPAPRVVQQDGGRNRADADRGRERGELLGERDRSVGEQNLAARRAWDEAQRRNNGQAREADGRGRGNGGMTYGSPSGNQRRGGEGEARRDDRGARDGQGARGRERGDTDGRNSNANDGRGGRDWNGGAQGRGGNDGRGRGGNDGRGNDGRDRDWNNNHNGGWNGNDGRGNDGRGHGGRGWDDNSRRDWSRNDWDRRRNDDHYRRYWGTHRDFQRPRYSDWRNVRQGYYFDFGYAGIASGYYGANYRWWGYPNWRRPHRRYIVGYVLPDYLYWDPVPYDLYYRLPPAPYGCRYVMVDRDILLIAISSGLILDALMYY